MKININKVLVFLLSLVIANLLNANLGHELLWESKINQINKSHDEYLKYQATEKELELEALLLLDSSKVIEDCIKDGLFLKLKNVYDKINLDPIYARPTKEQIAKWRKIIQEQIEQAKIDNKKAKESHTYLKQAIKNGAAIGVSFVSMMTLFFWGKDIIETGNGNKYLAQYAIDAGVIIGFPLNTFLLLKFVMQLIPNDKIEILNKTNSILLLFKELSEPKQTL